MIFRKGNEKHDNRVRTSWYEKWVESGLSNERNRAVLEELWKISKHYGPYIAR